MFRRSSRPACSGVIRVDQVLAKPKKGRATRRWPLLNPLISFRNLKRAKGFEPLTPTLARLLCGGPKQQVMMGAPSRNHLYRRRSQVMIDAGPRNHLYLLGAQVKIRSCPRNQTFIDFLSRKPALRRAFAFMAANFPELWLRPSLTMALRCECGPFCLIGGGTTSEVGVK